MATIMKRRPGGRREGRYQWVIGYTDEHGNRRIKRVPNESLPEVEVIAAKLEYQVILRRHGRLKVTAMSIDWIEAKMAEMVIKVEKPKARIVYRLPTLPTPQPMTPLGPHEVLPDDLGALSNMRPWLMSYRIGQICGVYFLLDGQEVVYVGQSIQIGGRICEHQRDTGKNFTHAVFIGTQERDLDAVEGAFINALKPKYNLRKAKTTKNSVDPLTDSQREVLDKYGGLSCPYPGENDQEVIQRDDIARCTETLTGPP